MLLVGQSHRTKALAADLLRITGDGKPQRSQQHNNPAMTTLKDSAGKFIFTPLQVYTQLIRRPRRQDSSTLGTMTVVISIQSTLTLDPAARLTMSL